MVTASWERGLPLEPVGLVRLEPAGLVRLEPAGLVRLEPAGLVLAAEEEAATRSAPSRVPPLWSKCVGCQP